MAITLVGSGNDRLDFGDPASFAGVTGFSFFIIHKPSSVTNDARIAGQWSDNFLFAIQDSDEIGFVVKETTGPVFYGKKTTDLNMSAGNEYRILVTVAFGSPPTIHIYVNGTDRTVAEFVGSGNVTEMSDAAQAFQVGHETSSATDGNDGDYSELAIWSRALTGLAGGEATELTVNNKLPTCIDATGRLIYLPMANTTDLTDQWGSITASLTGGANATHPTMVACGGGSSAPRVIAKFVRRIP